MKQILKYSSYFKYFFKQDISINRKRYFQNATKHHNFTILLRRNFSKKISKYFDGQLKRSILSRNNSSHFFIWRGEINMWYGSKVQVLMSLNWEGQDVRRRVRTKDCFRSYNLISRTFRLSITTSTQTSCISALFPLRYEHQYPYSPNS